MPTHMFPQKKALFTPQITNFRSATGPTRKQAASSQRANAQARELSFVMQDGRARAARPLDQRPQPAGRPDGAAAKIQPPATALQLAARPGGGSTRAAWAASTGSAAAAILARAEEDGSCQVLELAASEAVGRAGRHGSRLRRRGASCQRWCRWAARPSSATACRRRAHRSGVGRGARSTQLDVRRLQRGQRQPAREDPAELRVRAPEHAGARALLPAQRERRRRPTAATSLPAPARAAGRARVALVTHAARCAGSSGRDRRQVRGLRAQARPPAAARASRRWSPPTSSTAPRPAPRSVRRPPPQKKAPPK